jgi:hypothetical protein
MNLLSEIPKELKYIILSYLDYSDINDVSNSLELYVDYLRLIAEKYPKSYLKLRNYVSTESTKYYKELELIRYQDDPKQTCDRYTRVQPEYRVTDILEILCQIVLQQEYPELWNYFRRFPMYEHKYYVLYVSLINFNNISYINLLKDEVPELYELLYGDILIIGEEDITDHMIDYISDNFYEFGHILLYILYLKYGQVIKKGFDNIIDSELHNQYKVSDLDDINTDYDFVYRCLIVNSFK